MSDALYALLTNATVDAVVAGEAFGISRSAAYRAVKSGTFPAEKIGALYRCPTEPLLRKLGLDTPEVRAATLARVEAERAARPTSPAPLAA